MSVGMLNVSQNGIKWVPTLTTGIHTEQAIARNFSGLLIQSGNYPGKALVGCGLPGTVYFPDYNNPETVLQLEFCL